MAGCRNNQNRALLGLALGKIAYHLTHLIVITNHDDNNVADTTKMFERTRCFGTFFNHRVDGGLAQIIGVNILELATLETMTRHMVAHGADANKSNIHHYFSPSALRYW